MPVRKPNISPARTSERVEAVDYVFPECIVLDEESFNEFTAEMASPREPNAALCALFKR